MGIRGKNELSGQLGGDESNEKTSQHDNAGNNAPEFDSVIQRIVLITTCKNVGFHQMAVVRAVNEKSLTLIGGSICGSRE